MPPGHRCHPPCEDRSGVMVAGTFEHVGGVGWIDVTLPKRRSSPVAIVKYGLGKIREVWDGWPYVFDCCPWCGGSWTRFGQRWRCMGCLRTLPCIWCGATAP